MISIKNINKKFGKLAVLQDINLSFQKGQCIALIGPNGCGKTTLIKSILGMVIPDNGSITFNGKSILGDYLYRNNIGYMPQIGRYPDNMTIGQIIEMIKKISEYTSTIVRLQNEMTEARKTANNIENLEERATMYGINVKGFFEEIRYAVDKLELIVDDDEWPLPKYRELLLIK